MGATTPRRRVSSKNPLARSSMFNFSFMYSHLRLFPGPGESDLSLVVHALHNIVNIFLHLHFPGIIDLIGIIGGHMVVAMPAGEKGEYGNIFAVKWDMVASACTPARSCVPARAAAIVLKGEIFPPGGIAANLFPDRRSAVTAKGQRMAAVVQPADP